MVYLFIWPHIILGSIFGVELKVAFLCVQSIGSLQKKYAIGSFELLSKTAPMQALSLVFLGPIIDYCLNGKSILKYEFSPGAIVSSSLHPFPFRVSSIGRREKPNTWRWSPCRSSYSSLVYLLCSATSASISASVASQQCPSRFSATWRQSACLYLVGCCLIQNWLYRT